MEISKSDRDAYLDLLYDMYDAEAVLYKYNSYYDRTVICCSVMSGCPVGCRFCGIQKLRCY